MNDPQKIYYDLKKQVEVDYSGIAVSNSISEITIQSAKYLLLNCSVMKLKSLVQDKNYVCFCNSSGKLSRPLNENLFSKDLDKICYMCDVFKELKLEKLPHNELSELLYVIGMLFPCYIDIIKQNDKKTPGTFFEYLIGHIFAYKLGVNPRKKLQIPVAKGETPRYLPTDLIFDIPEKYSGLHVPIKSTTRERVIQVWAHQRILDSIYGVGRFRGILVVASETKLDSKKHEVIEICLPDQWRIYQLHIAKLHYIYYLDPPQNYLNLNKIFPNIPVRPFSDFFKETTKLF